MSSWPFSYRERVRFGDLDAMRHLNNVEFMRYFETARIAFLREVLPWCDPARPEGQFGVIFAEAHIVYRSPGRLDDVVRTSIRPALVRRSSFRVEFEMRVEGEERLLAEGWGTLVGYDYEGGRAMPLPDEVRARLEALSDGARGTETGRVRAHG